MPVTTAQAIGIFCWPELHTTDVRAAKKFYSTLFGWEPNDSPLPDGGSYTMLELSGDNVGAMTPLQDDQKKAGVPPHWMSYVSVTNADETAKKATSLGGKVIVPPFDVMDAGRMAVLQDPTGAAFALWQTKTHPGATRLNDVGALVWTELYTPDPEKASAFYSKLFGWRPKPFEGPNDYTVFEPADKDREARAGMMKTPEGMTGPPARWIPYFAVDDTDKVTARAKDQGAKVMMPPRDIPKVGRIAILTDPQEATFAIIKPNPA